MYKRQALGRLRDAALTYGEALLLCRRALSSRGESREALRDAALAYERVGDLRRRTRDLRGAREALETAQGLRRRLLAAAGRQDPRSLRELCVTAGLLGDLARDEGRGGEALAAYRDALDLARRGLELRGDTPQTLRDACAALARVGGALELRGERAGARAHLDEALALARRNLRAHPRLPAGCALLPYLLHAARRLRRAGGQADAGQGAL